MKKLFFFLLLFSTTHYCIGQQNDNAMKSPLDSVVNQLLLNYMKEGKRVGVSIGISYNGKSYTYNYGETAPSSGQLPSHNSIYEIGSITKTFTGLLIAHALTERKISLNDDIRKFLPGNFPNLQYSNGDPVKIAYLLAHTAQFPNSFDEHLSISMTEDIFLHQLHQIKLDSLKSFKYSYSNVGYQLLGYILAQVYHQSYASLVSKYITAPLGMLQTKLIYNAIENKNLLTGYNENKVAVTPIPINLPAAGALHSTVSDMLKYLEYQNLEQAQEVKLTHQVIFGDVDKEAYGYQWAIGKTWNWDQYIRIDGGTKGFRTFCVMYPLHQVSIVILSNQKDDSAGLGLYKVATGIYGAIKKQNQKH